ncbi:MAG: class I SAM-dependent methyltransferase [bacterium]|nr:class I SAM-dependent methyltransferase [bacterium]
MTRPDPPAPDPGHVLRDAPATHRNREPILEELARWLPPSARVLEIASGTGQHAVFFAERMPGLTWLPTDGDPESLGTIEAWIAERGTTNVEPPRRLDASRPDWAEAVGPIDAIFNANMIHIAPWEVALGLFEGAGRALATGGRLLLYGPFKVGGAHTSESNASFDASLQDRDARWGVRDVERVVELANAAGLTLVETREMPANNKLLVFERD